jgi:ATP-binding cassette, subfamily C, bacterial CydC
MSELISGADELAAYGAQDAALRCCEDADGELTRLARRSALAGGLGSGLAVAASGLTVWGVLLLGVAAVSGGTLTRVPLAVLTLTALAAFEAVTPLPGAAIALRHSAGSARRIARVLDEPDPVHDPAEPLARPAALTAVELRGARARYETRRQDALHGLDLDLRPGRRVALVGPSGAGKSTVASVLLRFCELAGGTAVLNDRPLHGYAADDVRALIGGCAQDPHIFDATIRDNLRVGRPSATDADLAAAAGRAGLLAWIESLPDGWETPAGPRGARLSGGQRQRLALARALLAGPAVLVLDEPVAHLDRGTRRALTADLLAATRGRATLLITHDLDGLDQVDEIVVLDGGAVVERGSHAQLLSSGGWYARMWREQMSTYTPVCAASLPDFTAAENAL